MSAFVGLDLTNNLGYLTVRAHSLSSPQRNCFDTLSEGEDKDSSAPKNDQLTRRLRPTRSPSCSSHHVSCRTSTPSRHPARSTTTPTRGGGKMPWPRPTWPSPYVSFSPLYFLPDKGKSVIRADELHSVDSASCAHRTRRRTASNPSASMRLVLLPRTRLVWARGLSTRSRWGTLLLGWAMCFPTLSSVPIAGCLV